MFFVLFVMYLFVLFECCCFCLGVWAGDGNSLSWSFLFLSDIYIVGVDDGLETRS